MKNRKPPTERELLDWLIAGEVQLPPLRIEVQQTRTGLNESENWDLLVEAIWNNQRVSMLVECKANATPKIFADTVRRLVETPAPPECRPLLLVPYLNDTQLNELAERELSGLDLCGNGVVIIPGKLLVYRGGGKNQFSTYSPIKNIYRKNTSMVARVLLTAPKFSSVQQVLEEVNRRNVMGGRLGETPMTLGTVSKALKQLEDELMISRDAGVRLLQPDKLLDALQQNYEPVQRANRLRLRLDCDFDELPQRILQKVDSKLAPVMATGLASVSRYAVMQREEVLSVYCRNPQAIQSALEGKETDRFPNLELIECKTQPPYFNAREVDRFLWASPVQSYLELMSGDKRDRETAEQVKSYLLRLLSEVS